MDKTSSHSTWTKWDCTIEKFLDKPEARMVSCGLPFSTEIQFIDGTYTVEDISQRLVVRYASHPESYLTQVLPSGDTVDWSNKSYDWHGDCYDGERRRITDETHYLNYLQERPEGHS